ncbi:MAG: hypothetical protein Q9181_005904 [Wetmoreana brouardii]
MASPQTASGIFMGSQPGSNDLLAAEDSTLADERQMFTLLWLYPDVSSLASNLLRRLEESWDYDCAFLLEEILKLQIIYRDYLGDVGSTGSALGDGALMLPDDVRRVTRVLSLNVVDYRPDIFDNLISRELQFKVLSVCFGKQKVLALSLILGHLLGIVSASETLYDKLRKGLVKQLEDTSKIRTAAAKDTEKTVHSFGQEDIYIRWALDSLSRPSYDHDLRMPLFKGIATVLFDGDTPDRFDLAKELAYFLEDSTSMSARFSQPFHGLHRLAIGAVSLARYSLLLEKDSVWRTVTERSEQIAVHVVMKIESLCRSQFVRLLHVFDFQKASTNRRAGEGVTHYKPAPGESYAAFDLLQIVSYLATEFGALKCFRTIRKQCSDLIEQSAGIKGSAGTVRE